MNKPDFMSLLILEDIFRERWNVELHTIEDQYSRLDCWFDYKGVRRYIEVKCRPFKSTQYPDTVIDIDKYNAIKKCGGSLIVMFEDCWYWFPDLDKALLFTCGTQAPSTTYFGGDYRMKELAYLDMKKGIRYNY